MKDDLTLKELGNFSGTQQYFRLSPFFKDAVGTDGIRYIMTNGYSWLVSDALAVIHMKIRDQPFIVVKLTLKEDRKGTVTYTDGNKKVLAKQHYEYTDAKKEVKMYFTNGVLMLPSEY